MAAKVLKTRMPLPRLLFVGLTIQMLEDPAVLIFPIASPRVAPALFLRGERAPSASLSFFPGDLTSAGSVEAAEAASSALPPVPLAGDLGFRI
jgi:hypothetical protein